MHGVSDRLEVEEERRESRKRHCVSMNSRWYQVSEIYKNEMFQSFCTPRYEI